MSLLIFLNTNKFETITMKLLVQLLGKVLSVVWNIAMKAYPKFVRFR